MIDTNKMDDLLSWIFGSGWFYDIAKQWVLGRLAGIEYEVQIYPIGVSPGEGWEPFAGFDPLDPHVFWRKPTASETGSDKPAEPALKERA